MNIIFKLDDVLKKVLQIGYWKLPIPSDVDMEIINCIKNSKSLSNDDQLNIKNSINTDIARMLLYFSERMATLSLRTNDQDVFLIGLLALDMIGGREDIREILLIMPLYYDVSKRNKLSFDKVLSQNDDFASFVKDFLSRNEDEKTLESMGYILTKDGSDNPIYQRTW